MNTGGDAAEQVIRMSLNGAEVALKISGVAAKEVATMLYAILKDNKKSKGRTRLENLIKTGRPLTIFTVKVDDFDQFKKEAKRYGILYCAVRNGRGTEDGMVDVMVKQEDASRVDRIVDRFKLSDVSQSAQIKADIEKTRSIKKQRDVLEQEKPEKSENEKVMEQIFTKPLQKEEASVNPKVAKMENSRPSEPISKQIEGEPFKLPKPSVKKELAEIKKKQEQKLAEPQKEKAKQLQHADIKHTEAKKRKRKER
ncbi:PcfB family protein [[Eubacterium] hominis]|uniref:PcfB family protein n=1 Tax=[Eubacterium] hominis TaxID=2764325 RepID=UPI003A4D340B